MVLAKVGCAVMPREVKRDSVRRVRVKNALDRVRCCGERRCRWMCIDEKVSIICKSGQQQRVDGT